MPDTDTHDAPADGEIRHTRTCPTCGLAFHYFRRRGFAAGRHPTYCSRTCNPSAHKPGGPSAGNPTRKRKPGTLPGRKRPDSPASAGHDREYTDEESAFLKACEAYRQTHRKSFLTACEFLAIARSLGYRKDAPQTGNQTGDGDG